MRKTFGSIATIALLGITCGAAMPETGRTVFLPTTFKVEGEAIRTSACLQVTERIYPATAWWELAGGKPGAAEAAFMNVIAAIKGKDRALLLKLTDPTQAHDTKNFDQQAEAFFQQFGFIKLVAVPHAYQFDGLMVFFGKFQAGDQSAFLALSFAVEPDGSFGFLPSRSEKLTYQLLDEWVQSKWGLSGTGSPSYCSEREIKRATHRAALGTLPGATKQTAQSSQLLIGGAPLNAPGDFADSATRVKAAVEKMKSALSSKGSDELLQCLTAQGAKKLKESLDSASEADVTRYKASIAKELDQPFFFFDASPLMIVYTKSADASIHEFYFTPAANNDLLWTNSSYITISDKVFKQGVLREAAAIAKPFSSIAIQ